MRIDLNADVGEGCEDDEALMASITSANIAAGAHAGSPSLLRRTVRCARRFGVAIGAHPGFQDREHFGRRELAVSPAEVEDFVLYQIAAVAGVARAEGAALRHVKPHGALFNMAVRDRSLADAVVRGVTAFDRSLIVFTLPGSALAEASAAAGLAVAREAFADRAYMSDGQLVGRDHAGAVIHDRDAVVRRAVAIAVDRRVEATDGSSVVVEADSICVHGDTPGAAGLALAIRSALTAAGVVVSAPAATHSL
jgi:UPF0271 protein